MLPFLLLWQAKGSEDKFLSIKELSERPLEMNQPIFYVSLAQPPSAKKAEDDSISDTSLTAKSKKTRVDKDKVDKGAKETKGYVSTYSTYIRVPHSTMHAHQSIVTK